MKREMISEPGKETVFIQPLTKNSKTQYLVYNRSARGNVLERFECLTKDLGIEEKAKDILVAKDANDQLLRTFRIAISVTSEYTAFWDDGDATNGDDKADALAQLVSTLDRVNEIFEVDMAITFVLVDTADDPALDLIYSGTDPYTDDFSFELQTNLTTTVGLSDFDLGHLFVYNPTENNGSAGCIGCVCDNTVDQGIGKGSGFSAHKFLDNDDGPYLSDFFDVDFVAHEIGHQMGGNHTWSFNSEGTGVNMEPASGTTIMGYAGITGANDVQDHTDPYFHYASINQILNNITSAPNDCAGTTIITNNPPIANAGPDYIIPNGTAFILKASATDADAGDILTYTWEQIDDGVTTNENFGPTKPSGAVWRSRPPSTSPNRYMPILERVISGQLTESNPIETIANTSWETVSTVARELNFGLTVRDRAETGGVGQSPQSDFDEMKVTVDGTAGPFVVTSQTTSVLWPISSIQNVSWDVAGTNTGVINATTVNILLSIDGGQTFPFTIASNVPNDGSHDIVVPDIEVDITNTARIMIEANNNIFYAVNSADFTVQNTEFAIFVSNPAIEVCLPTDEIVYNFTYNTFFEFNDITNFSVTGEPAQASIVINPISTTTDGTTGTVTVSEITNLATGSYDFTIEATSGASTQSVDVTFVVYSETLNATNLSTPANNNVDISLNPDLTWIEDRDAEVYLVEVAADENFTTIISSGSVQTASYSVENLNASTQYFWRVTASNPCVSAETSSVYNFTTVGCETYNSTENNITIPDEGTDVHRITSGFTISDAINIDDINVTVNIQHVYVEDVALRLTSPAGTQVILLNQSCGDGADIAVTFDDQGEELECNVVAPVITGVVQPVEALSAFKGENAEGEWVLEVFDIFPSVDGGEFLSFSIEACGATSTLSVDEFGQEAALSIWPNPSNGEINISLNLENNNEVNISLFDLTGRLISEKSFDNPTDSFREKLLFDNLNPSVYILSIENNGKRVNKQIVVK